MRFSVNFCAVVCYYRLMETNEKFSNSKKWYTDLEHYYLKKIVPTTLAVVLKDIGNFWYKI
jgi:hypothetical protein